MPLKTTPIRLDDKGLGRVGETAHAVEQFVRDVEKGIKVADEARLVDHAEVKAKWEARLDAALD